MADKKKKTIKTEKKSKKGERHKRGMTDMAWNFCHAYVRMGRKQAAALSVGCTQKSAASTATKWLKNPKVIKKIEQLKKKLNIKLELKAEDVIREYMRIAFTNLTDVVDISEGIPKLKELEAINPDHLAAIQAISQTANGLKIKMHDKKGSLDSLSNHLGIFQSGIHIGDIIIKTDEEDEDL